MCEPEAGQPDQAFTLSGEGEEKKTHTLIKKI